MANKTKQTNKNKQGGLKKMRQCRRLSYFSEVHKESACCYVNKEVY